MGGAPLRVFLIFYGAAGFFDTPLGAGNRACLEHFVKHIAPPAPAPAPVPAWWSLMRGYPDGRGALPAAAVTLGGSVALAPSDVTGASSSAALTQAIVFAAVQAGAAKAGWALDADAFYVVATGPGVAQTLGASGGGDFCTGFCGWHSSNVSSIGGGALAKFAFVGDATACPASCDSLHVGAQGRSPNRWSWQANAMASILAHELAEAVSNPVSTGWWSAKTGAENGDLCAWSYGERGATARAAAAATN